MNILIFAPHPDDDVLGCGGSIIKYAQAKQNVAIVYITSGEAGDSKVSQEHLAATRESEATESATLMGVTDVTFLRFKDGGVTYSEYNLHVINQLLRDKKPDTVYIPGSTDAHHDHQVTHQLVMESIFRAGAKAFQDIKGDTWNVGTVLTYEVWTPMSQFAYTEDITSVIETKLDAMKLHASQLKNVAYDEAIRGLNRYRGALTGTGTYCECFGVLKINKLNQNS